MLLLALRIAKIIQIQIEQLHNTKKKALRVEIKQNLFIIVEI